MCLWIAAVTGGACGQAVLLSGYFDAADEDELPPEPVVDVVDEPDPESDPEVDAAAESDFAPVDELDFDADFPPEARESLR